MDTLDLFNVMDSTSSDNTPPAANPDASSSSSTPVSELAPPQSSQPTLNEEVSQVIGQLGRFWGGVRKQSQTAFETARKDLSVVVTQAQREFERLGQRPTELAAQETEEKLAECTDVHMEPALDNSSAESAPASSRTDVPASSSLFSFLQSSLSSNLTPTALSTTLQRHLPEALQHGLNFENANADFTQLRTALAANIQRVQQGTTMQQAEKLAEQYMRKGEALFKEAGEFLKDAVKVVPPEELGETPGVVWDGTDAWSIPIPIHTDVKRGGSRKGKGKESDVIFNMPKAAAKRTDILLKRLRNDPELVRQDPWLDKDESVKALWSSFVTEEVDAHGGIGGEVWTTRIVTALESSDKDEDAKALVSLRDQLVPTELTNDVFWTRYFFRVHQIEREEERRKALLADAHQEEEDFNWEDEDEGEDPDKTNEDLSHSQSEKTPVDASSSTLSPSPKPSTNPTGVPALPVQKPPCSASQSTSPRESEDSYDLVSSGNVSSSNGRNGDKKPKETDKDGDDSDWE